MAGRVPVIAGAGLVEMADAARLRALMRAPNVEALRHRGRVVELRILDFGASFRVPSKWGNSQRLSTNLEAYDNPPRVWKLKRLPD